MSFTFYLALLLAFVGSVLIYLASKHQLWLSSVGSPLLLRRLGLFSVAVSLVMLIGSMQTVAAVFSLVVWLMLLLGVFPYLGAWKSLRKSRR